MRLIHHDKEYISFDRTFIYPSRKDREYFKPNGLWVSDEDSYGWSHWCTAEHFAVEHLECEHRIELWPDNNILFIRSVEEIDKFHEEYAVDMIGRIITTLPSGEMWERKPRKDWVDWTVIYPLCQGIIVTPYLWERRMDYMWYYGWDCAGGCIWDLSAIRTFEPLFKQLTWKGG